MRKLATAVVVCILSLPAMGQSPGGISSNLRLWLKADAGVNGTVPVISWTDQSPNGFVASATGNQPHILFEYINYYPAIDFNFANAEYLTIPSGIFGGAAYNNVWVYVVSSSDRIAEQSLLFETMTGATHSFDVLLPWSNSNTYLDFGDRNTGTGRINGAWGGALGQFNFWTFGTNTTTATPNGTRKAISRDGQVILSSAANGTATGNNQPFTIGGGYLDGVPTTRPFDGQISEIIIYTGVPTVQEQEQIHSYLSMKYGITKRSTDNTTTVSVDERDYFSSAGAILWDYSNNTTYHNNIAAIGRDNASGLSQSKGRSLTGSIIMDAGAAMTNGDFILCGDNNAAAGASLDVPGSYALRSNKIWKVSTAGSPGLITLSIELDDLGIPSGLPAASYALLQDTDETFATGSLPHTTGASVVNNVLTFTGVTLSHDGYFTIAATSPLKGPANVTANLKMWLRADKNVTGSAPVSQWKDHSGNGYNATAGAGPSVLQTDANFNPALDFTSASSQYMQVAQGTLGNNQYNNAWVYVVNKPDVSQNHTIFYEQAFGANKVFDFIGPWSSGTNNVYYEFGTNNGSGRINTAWGGSFGNYYMWTLGSSTGISTPTGSRKSISRDGSVLLTNNNNDFLIGNNQPFYIAGGYNTGIPTSNMFDGKIAEIIMYTGVPTPLEQEKIQSYLAIKYGLTKNSADNIGTAEDERDYFASDGTVVVDYSAFTSYLNHLTVIGRDDASELDQRISKGQSSAAVLTIDKGGPLPNDRDFIAAGDNVAAAGYNTDVPIGYERRINRVWRTQVTGSPGNVGISVNITDLGVPFGLQPAEYALLIDTDETFASGASTYAAASVANGVVTFSNVTVPNDGYLTIAIADGVRKGPGDVKENLRLWLRADYGTTGTAPVSSWNDRSGNGFSAVTAGSAPDLIANDLNFNPTLDFTRASSEYLQITGGIMRTNTYNSMWVYYVARNDINTNNTLFNENIGGDRFAVLNVWSNDALFQYGNNNTDATGGRVRGLWGGTLGQPHMWTMGASTSLSTPNGTRKSISRDGAVILFNDGNDTGTGSNQNFFIGGRWNGLASEYFDGQLAELIVYTEVPTIQEQEKVQSYLAIKYGITKNSADNPGSPEDERDYFASDGTVLWDYSTLSAYQNSVTIIGRDDVSELDQRKSRNFSTAGIITLDKAGPFASNLAFVGAGDDNAANGHNTNVPSGYQKRINKIWRTQVTGAPGTLSVSINLFELGIPEGLNAASYALLVDTDADFSDATTVYPGTSNTGGVVGFTGVTVTSSSFLTVAVVDNAIKGPGNVTENIRLWLRADVGTTGAMPLATWADQSGNGFTATAGSASPDLITNRLNFNPVLDFTRASSEYLQVPAGIFRTNTFSSVWAYYVARTDLNVNNTVFNENLGGDRFAVLNSWSGDALFQYGNNNTDATGGRLRGAWGGTLGEYYMWTMGASTSTSTPNGTRKAISRNGVVILSNDGNDTATGSNQPLFIGGRWNGAASEYYDGEIAELIVYTGTPTILEQEKIHSYLSIKYGLPKNTVDNAGSAEDERDYFASNGSVIWDYSNNAPYNTNIVGIGRDDRSLLDQRKSKNIGATSDLTLEHSTPFGTDLNFVICGDNNVVYGSSTDVPTGLAQRLTKAWRASVTGTPGNVDVTIDINNLGLPIGLPSGAYALLIDADGVYSNASIHTAGVVNTNGIVSFTGVPLTDGAFFTVAFDAAFMKGPGNVTTNLRLWLRANTEVTGTTPVTGWDDQSGYEFNATVPANGPDLMADQANFNPTLDFTRSNSEYMQITGGIVKNLALPHAWVYYVSRGDVAAPNQTTFNENLASTRYFAGLNPYSSGVYYITGNNTDNQGRISGPWGGTVGQYHMWTNGTSTGVGTPSGFNKAISRDGAVILTGTTTDTGTGNNQNFFIGGRWTGANNDYHDGQIAELIVYNGVPTPIEQEKVQSYLALKYGITKNSADNATTATVDERDYIASNETVFWDYSVYSAHHNNVVGIGRDDGSELDQRKSRSAGPAGYLTIDKGGAFGSNLDFLVAGDNNVGGSSTEVPGTCVRRSGRVWRADITGSPGAVSLTFNLANLNLPNTFPASAYRLLIDTDGNFTNATEHALGSPSVSAGQYTATDVTLNEGDYFTIAMVASAFRGPGNVTQGLQLWLKAGTGVTGTTPVTQWSDQSGLDRHAVTIANGPTLLSQEINFNPAIDFNRTSQQYMAVPSGVLRNGAYTNVWAYVVSKADGVFNQTVFFEGLGTKMFNALIPWGDNVFYSEFGTNNSTGRVNAAWGGNTTNYFMWTMGSSTGTSTPSGARKTIYRNGTVLASNANNDSGSGANQPFYIGGGYVAGTPTSNNFDGKIAEMIVYTSVPSVLEQEKVHSYLGIKYGIVKTTIDNVATGGTDERDYFASDGSVVWDFSNWGVYTNNAFGVGRDDGSELDQRKSKANNGSGYMTIEHDGAFPADLSFVICADNGVSGTSTDVPGSLQKRSGRVWRADLTGTPGTVSLTFDLADLGLLSSLPVGNYEVLLDADGTFATGATSHTTGASLNSGQFTVTGVTLTEGMYISIGIIPGPARGPANVSNNLHLWLKADMGVTGTAPVSAWDDQSGFNRHANSTTSGPTLIADEFNFNPGLDFVTASAQHLIIPGGIMRSFTFNSVWTYVVMKADIVQDNTVFFETMAGGKWFAGLIGYTGNTIYYDFGNGGGAGRITGAWGSAVSTPNIWTLAASTSTATPNGTRRTIYRDGLAILSNANADNGTGNNSPFTIGAGHNTGSPALRNLDGKVAELIVFNGTPTVLEQERIHSYLAIKYGITKLSGNNGSTTEDERDYFASDGSVIWDFSVNTAYSNRILGIGKDGELNQTTSASSLSTGILRLSNPSNLDDLEYLVMGDNNGLVNAGGVTDKPAGVFSRIARTWMTAVKGSPGTVSLRFNLSAAPGPKDPAHLVLLVDRNKNGLFADETVVGGGIISGATLVSGETFEFSGVTLTDGELVSVGSTSGLTPLPIVLLSFEAQPRDGMIHLTWTTASEVNNDFFKLHKSFDGAEFREVARIKGQGTTSKRTDYEYYDEQGSNDIIYYRLTQVDLDGMETASRVVSVRPDQVPFDFRIVPNPAEKEITVRVFNAADPQVWLYNAQGIRVNAPAQLTKQGFVIDVGHLASGLYLVAVKDGGKTLVKRLVRK